MPINNSYGPFGQPGGVPPAIGGVDDLDSLFLGGMSEPDPNNGFGWFPQLVPGRYIVNDESDFSYQFSRPQSVALNVSAGLQTVTVELPSAEFIPSTFADSPIQLSDSVGRVFTPVHNTVRWAYPVPSGNITIASGFVDDRFLFDVNGQQTPTGPTALDNLWWLPTFGAEVISVHRSRNARSFDVLADEDALLYEVSTPDQLVNDRAYCYDPLSGIVFGRYPSQPLAPPPYGSGLYATTYVTLAYPGDADPALGSLGLSAVDLPFWQKYFTQNQDFYNLVEGASGNTYYDPLRLEEVAVVDTDNLIRLRRPDVVGLNDFSGKYAPSVLYASPDGPLVCKTTSVSGNVIDAQLPDPSSNNQYSLLEYGTTVIVRYYVKNSFTLAALTGGPIKDKGEVFATLHILADNTSSGTSIGTLTYETDPHGMYLSQLNGSPNLNPLVTPISNGFLYLEDQDNPASLPTSYYGIIDIGVSRPVILGSESEVFPIRCSLLDNSNIQISSGHTQISFVPSGAAVITSVSPSNQIAGPDGYVVYRIKPLVSTSFNINLSDARNPNTILASGTIYPIVVSGTTVSVPLGINRVSQPWEPTIFISLGESYRTVGGQPRKMVRVTVLGPDGFPWNGTQQVAGTPKTTQPALITLSSESSIFHSPNSDSLDLPLGSQVSAFFDGTSTYLSPSGVLKVGYTVVSGDTLSASFYIGDDKYISFPLSVD